jgi:hypothetical protein
MAAVPDTIDAGHRRRLIADSKAAVALGLPVNDYRTQRTAAIAQWTHTIRSLMDQHGVIDPLEVLPGILAAVEEHAIGAAKAAAASAARDELQRLLRKATA